MIHLIERDESAIVYIRQTGDFYSIEDRYLEPIRELVAGCSGRRRIMTPEAKEVQEMFGPYLGSDGLDGRPIGEVCESGAPSMRVRRATIMLTTECNLRCRYCYEAKQNGETPSPNTPSLSRTDASEVVSFLVRVCPTVDSLMFFGGEPLLRFSLLQAIVRLVEAERRSGSLRVGSYGIITNGTLLTQDMVDFLSEYGFSVTVSCDGSQQIHDRWRVDRDGRGTWRQVRTAIDLLQRSGVQYGIEATLTPEHIEEGYTPSGLTDLFASWGCHHPHITHVQTDQGWSSSDAARLAESFAIAASENIAAIERGELDRVRLFSRFGMMLKALVGRQSSPLRCPAANEITFGPKGEIYPCFMFSGYPETIMGNIADFDAAKLQSRRLQFLRVSRKDQNDQCGKCWANRLCSGCMGANYAPNANMQDNDQTNCRVVKRTAEEMMIAFARLQADPSRWQKFVENYRTLMQAGRASGCD